MILRETLEYISFKGPITNLVLGPKREIYFNVSRKITQQLFCHIRLHYSVYE